MKATLAWLDSAVRLCVGGEGISAPAAAQLGDDGDIDEGETAVGTRSASPPPPPQLAESPFCP